MREQGSEEEARWHAAILTMLLTILLTMHFMCYHEIQKCRCFDVCVCVCGTQVTKLDIELGSVLDYIGLLQMNATAFFPSEFPCCSVVK